MLREKKENKKDFFMSKPWEKIKDRKIKFRWVQSAEKVRAWYKSEEVSNDVLKRMSEGD